MTKPVTRKMVVDWFLYNENFTCSLCDTFLDPGGDIQWDHIQADVFDGPHDYMNIRPVHAECHKKKTARDIKDNAKIKRLTGQTKTGPKKRIASKPFEKRTQPYVWPKRKFAR